MSSGWNAESLAAALIANPALARRNPDQARRLVTRLPTALSSEPDQAQDGTGEPDLTALMACGSFAGRLDPEQELSHWVACELRKLTRSGRLRAVWSVHPAEVRMGGRLGSMWQSLLVFIGVIPGSSDIVVTWGTGSGWIELKTEARQDDLPGLIARRRRRERSYLRRNQPKFRDWCVSLGVRHAVCRNVPEVLATLREWGRL